MAAGEDTNGARSSALKAQTAAAKRVLYLRVLAGAAVVDAMASVEAELLELSPLLPPHAT